MGTATKYDGFETETTRRLAGLREAITAANGDWHEVTNLWSVQGDLDWLLAFAERLATPTPDMGQRTPDRDDRDREVERIENAIRKYTESITDPNNGYHTAYHSEHGDWCQPCPIEEPGPAALYDAGLRASGGD